MNQTISENKKIGHIADRPVWMTYASLIARAFHQIGAAVFLAYYLIAAGTGPPLSYLFLAAISGIILMAVEAVRHRQLLKEVSGLTTVIKCVFIGLAFHQWIPSTVTILLVFFVASIVSHAPKKIRHKLLF